MNMDIPTNNESIIASLKLLEHKGAIVIKIKMVFFLEKHSKIKHELFRALNLAAVKKDFSFYVKKNSKSL